MTCCRTSEGLEKARSGGASRDVVATLASVSLTFVNNFCMGDEGRGQMANEMYRKGEENGEGKSTRLDVGSHLNTKRAGWIRTLQHSGSYTRQAEGTRRRSDDPDMRRARVWYHRSPEGIYVLERGIVFFYRYGSRVLAS